MLLFYLNALNVMLSFYLNVLNVMLSCYLNVVNAIMLSSLNIMLSYYLNAIMLSKRFKCYAIVLYNCYFIMLSKCYSIMLPKYPKRYTYDHATYFNLVSLIFSFPTPIQNQQKFKNAPINQRSNNNINLFFIYKTHNSPLPPIFPSPYIPYPPSLYLILSPPQKKVF